MNRYTLSHARQSALPKASGVCADDLSEVAAIVNEAQERLLHDPLTPDEGWYGGWATMVFNASVTDQVAYVTTPRDVARLIVTDVCKIPVRIRNGFYEYLQFGAGLKPDTCNSYCNRVKQAYERDNVVTLSSLLSTPQLIRFYITDSVDVGKRVLVQGEDQNSQDVISTDPNTQQAIQGEYVVMDQPFSTTINQFSTITAILKDVFLGKVQIFQVNPDTDAENVLSSMEPQETSASYRRYVFDGLPSNCCNTGSGIVQISAQVKLDFIPVVSDPDFLLIQSIPALIEEAQAIKYSRMDSRNAAQLEIKHHARAIQLLNGQLDHYFGKTQTAIGVSLFGSDKLKTQPI